jgi:dehydrogenase/reductase SDR family protein 7B
VSFEGKIVWVTGASSGIGRSLAQAFADRGARLILSARREQKLREVQALCKEPDAHHVLPLDLLDAAALQPAAIGVLEQFGHVDILVNNAGISQRSLAKDTNLEVDRQIMETNYFGPVALTKLLLPSMIERRAGHIVVVSSLLGKFGVAYRTAYAGSKHALLGFFDALRLEVHEAGVRVTVVCPGFIRTDASRNALSIDGKPSGKMDDDIRQGMDPDACARQILRAIAKGKREVYVGGKEKMALLLKRLSPQLFHRVVLKTRLK